MQTRSSSRRLSMEPSTSGGNASLTTNTDSISESSRSSNVSPTSERDIKQLYKTPLLINMGRNLRRSELKCMVREHKIKLRQMNSLKRNKSKEENSQSGGDDEEEEVNRESNQTFNSKSCSLTREYVDASPLDDGQTLSDRNDQLNDLKVGNLNNPSDCKKGTNNELTGKKLFKGVFVADDIDLSIFDKIPTIKLCHIESSETLTSSSSTPRSCSSCKTVLFNKDLNEVYTSTEERSPRINTFNRNALLEEVKLFNDLLSRMNNSKQATFSDEKVISTSDLEDESHRTSSPHASLWECSKSEELNEVQPCELHPFHESAEIEFSHNPILNVSDSEIEGLRSGRSNVELGPKKIFSVKSCSLDEGCNHNKTERRRELSPDVIQLTSDDDITENELKHGIFQCIQRLSSDVDVTSNSKNTNNTNKENGSTLRSELDINAHDLSSIAGNTNHSTCLQTKKPRSNNRKKWSKPTKKDSSRWDLCKVQLKYIEKELKLRRMEDVVTLMKETSKQSPSSNAKAPQSTRKVRRSSRLDSVSEKTVKKATTPSPSKTETPKSTSKEKEGRPVVMTRKSLRRNSVKEDVQSPVCALTSSKINEIRYSDKTVKGRKSKVDMPQETSPSHRSPNRETPRRRLTSLRQATPVPTRSQDETKRKSLVKSCTQRGEEEQEKYAKKSGRKKSTATDDEVDTCRHKSPDKFRTPVKKRLELVLEEDESVLDSLTPKTLDNDFERNQLKTEKEVDNSYCDDRKRNRSRSAKKTPKQNNSDLSLERDNDAVQLSSLGNSEVNIRKLGKEGIKSPRKSRLSGPSLEVVSKTSDDECTKSVEKKTLRKKSKLTESSMDVVSDSDFKDTESVEGNKSSKKSRLSESNTECVSSSNDTETAQKRSKSPKKSRLSELSLEVVLKSSDVVEEGTKSVEKKNSFKTSQSSESNVEVVTTTSIDEGKKSAEKKSQKKSKLFEPSSEVLSKTSDDECAKSVEKKVLRKKSKLFESSVDVVSDSDFKDAESMEGNKSSKKSSSSVADRDSKTSPKKSRLSELSVEVVLKSSDVVEEGTKSVEKKNSFKTSQSSESNVEVVTTTSIDEGTKSAEKKSEKKSGTESVSYCDVAEQYDETAQRSKPPMKSRLAESSLQVVLKSPDAVENGTKSVEKRKSLNKSKLSESSIECASSSDDIETVQNRNKSPNRSRLSASNLEVVSNSSGAVEEVATSVERKSLKKSRSSDFNRENASNASDDVDKGAQSVEKSRLSDVVLVDHVHATDRTENIVAEEVVEAVTEEGTLLRKSKSPKLLKVVTPEERRELKGVSMKRRYFDVSFGQEASDTVLDTTPETVVFSPKAKSKVWSVSEAVGDESDGVIERKKKEKAKRARQELEDTAANGEVVGKLPNCPVSKLPESLLRSIRDRKTVVTASGGMDDAMMTDTFNERKKKKKKKRKMMLDERDYGYGYIPLEVSGPTKFGVVALDRFKDKRSPVSNPKMDLMYRSSLKRVPYSDIQSYSHKKERRQMRFEQQW